ncbi:hypothetical protein SSCG_00911 [Streptomyces clavuligerus]|nr:hypothetical protein SSCG_00911 [Streptomyces clavuligerus]
MRPRKSKLSIAIALVIVSLGYLAVGVLVAVITQELESLCVPT